MAVVALGRDIIVAGGFTGGFTSGRPPPTDVVTRWDAGTATWILVVGGSMNGIMPSDDVDVYDPRTDAWGTLPKLPEKRKGAVARQVGHRIVVSTGSPTSTDPIATTFVGCCL
jgi:hypothetical protein